MMRIGSRAARPIRAQPGAGHACASRAATARHRPDRPRRNARSAVRVAAGDDAELRRPVRAVADPRRDVRRTDGGLRHLGEVVVGIAVQVQPAKLDRRQVPARPDPRQVERIERGQPRFRLGHHRHADARRDSRSAPIRRPAFASVRHWRTRMVLKGNFTRTRALAASIGRQVGALRPFMCRSIFGRPRSENRIVTRRRRSGDRGTPHRPRPGSG